MLKRNLTNNIQTSLKDTPVILINGARQTGKSTLAEQLIKGRQEQYFTLDDLGTLAAVRSDPQGFLASQKETCVIDEIQRAPELFVAIKANVDKNRKAGRFLLAGSANVLLVPKISESLAGRIEIHHLWPFSQGELLGHQERFIDNLFHQKIPKSSDNLSASELLDKIRIGGYPEIIVRNDQARRKSWFRSYLTTVIHREIRDLANIEGINELPRLLTLLAARTSSLTNYSELARSTGLPQTTLKRYLTLLEATFLIVSIPAWAKNFGKRLVKSPKFFLNDTGLITHLLDIDKERITEDRNLIGPLLENFVLMELMKQITWSTTQPSIFHFRTHNNDEIDFLLENSAGKIVGIEVKASNTIQASDFKTLRDFANQMKKTFICGVVLYSGDKIIPFGENLYALPFSCLWTA